MAFYHGKDGVFKVGANTVAECQEWSVEDEVDVAPAPAQGQEWERINTGEKRWSGSLTCWHDMTDTNGQLAIDDAGNSVTLNLYPEGETSGLRELTGTAIVTKVTHGSAQGDNVPITIEFRGNGALTKNLVTP